MKLNGLNLNASKTEILLIRSSRPNVQTSHHILLDGTTIEQVQIFKLLDIYINSNLTWNDHTKWISAKASRSIALLRRLS